LFGIEAGKQGRIHGGIIPQQCRTPEISLEAFLDVQSFRRISREIQFEGDLQ